MYEKTRVRAETEGQEERGRVCVEGEIGGEETKTGWRERRRDGWADDGRGVARCKCRTKGDAGPTLPSTPRSISRR